MGERGTTRRMCLLQTGLLLSLHSAVILLADPHLSPRCSVRRCLLKIHGAARVTRARRTGAGEDVCGFWPRLSAGRVSVTGQACQQRQIVAVAAARAPLRVNQRLVPSVVSSSLFSFIFFTPSLTLEDKRPPVFCGPLLGNHWCKCWWHIKGTGESTSWLVAWRLQKSLWWREKLTQSAAWKQDAFAAFLPNSRGAEEKQKEQQEHAGNLHTELIRSGWRGGGA